MHALNLIQARLLSSLLLFQSRSQQTFPQRFSFHSLLSLLKITLRLSLVLEPSSAPGARVPIMSASLLPNLTQADRTPRSLHEKAARVVPDLGAKPSTIAVAILREEKRATDELQQDDFLWVKCNAVRPVHVFDSQPVRVMYRSGHPFGLVRGLTFAYRR